jgi:hypothetical protein
MSGPAYTINNFVDIHSKGAFHDYICLELLRFWGKAVAGAGPAHFGKQK